MRRRDCKPGGGVRRHPSALHRLVAAREVPVSKANTTDDHDSGLRTRTKPDPILVDATAAAEMLSISERAFHSLRKRANFPQDATVVLGPRCVRFRLEALHAFALAHVSIPRDEPGQLRVSRGERTAKKPQAAADSADAALTVVPAANSGLRP